jgi:hypothetical protein
LIGLSGLPVLCHPYWMDLRSADLKGIHGLAALEVFNTTCELYNGKGLSDALWDELLARGTQLWGIAAMTHIGSLSGTTLAVVGSWSKRWSARRSQFLWQYPRGTFGPPLVRN